VTSTGTGLYSSTSIATPASLSQQLAQISSQSFTAGSEAQRRERLRSDPELPSVLPIANMKACTISSMKVEFMETMNFNSSYQRNNKAKGKKNLVRSVCSETAATFQLH
jgi:hypothetical protein